MQNDLLTFEKMESGLMDLRKENVTPISVVRDSIQIFVLQAKSKNIKLELITSGESIYSYLHHYYPRILFLVPFSAT